MLSASIRSALVLLLCMAASLPCVGQALGDSGDVLKVGGPWGPKTLDVQKTGYVFKRLGVVENLVEVDQSLKLVPGLAKSWSVSADMLTWTFKLREDVAFHDGTPLKAGIVKQNLERLLEVGSLLDDVPLARIEAPDETTLRLVTSKPFAPLAAYLSKGEAAALAPSSFDSSGEVVKPVGTGPFVFKTWQIKDEVVTVRNDHYWGPKRAKVERVVYRAVPDVVTRLAMLRSGDLDIAQILPPQTIESLEASPRFEVKRQAIGRCRLIAFNMAKEPFSDQRVRRAVNMAVSRRDLVQYVLNDVGQASVSLYPPNVHWANDSLTGFPYDPNRAKELLAKAGWRDADADGVLEKNGKPLKVSLVTYPERAALPPTAEVIQAQLQEVGFRVELVVTQVDAAHGRRDQGEFDMFLVGRGLLFVPDPDYNLMKDYFSKNTSRSGWGAYHYENERIDELLHKGRTTFDQKERKAIYDRVQAILIQDAPMMYLNYYVNVDAIARHVQGYQMHPTESTYRLENVRLTK